LYVRLSTSTNVKLNNPNNIKTLGNFKNFIKKFDTFAL